MGRWKKYLLWFAQEHVDFRLSEIDSLLSVFKIQMRYQARPQKLEPYWLVEFASEEDATLLASRSVSLRTCLELWGSAHSISELHTQLESKAASFAKHFDPNKSFRITVDTFGRRFTQNQKVDKLEHFSYLPVQGPVNLSHPDMCLHYIEYYGTRALGPPEKPYNVFFGRSVGTGLRQLVQTLSLKTRKFIGNTTMDPQLSILMANQAQITPNQLVFDPFVGSGSLLVTAAHLGGYVLGADIDYMMLHAKTKPSRIKQKVRAADESVLANLKQYGLEARYLDVLVQDFATDFWRRSLEFDIILTDPPYGIRESAARVGTLKVSNGGLSEEHVPTHVPSKVDYDIPDIYRDLLAFSAKHLRVGGRLVCWFPVFREDYTECSLPSHACLQLVANSEQVLSKLTSRRLLTYTKVRHPEEAETFQTTNIQDFRGKYLGVRAETRKERRTREAQLRKENWDKYIESKN